MAVTMIAKSVGDIVIAPRTLRLDDKTDDQVTSTMRTAMLCEQQAPIPFFAANPAMPAT